MKLLYIAPVVFFGILLWSGIPLHQAYAYDTQQYEAINSSLSCQCGCGLLVSVCTMDGCMCEGVRKQVGQMLDEGRSEDEVVQAMVSIYGEQILAAPPKSGFNLSAYVLPFFFLIFGGIVLYSVVKRWVPVIESPDENPENAASPAQQDEPDLKHKSRIEEELKELDI